MRVYWYVAGLQIFIAQIAFVSSNMGLFDCNHYQPWNVTYDDQQQAMATFQNWLYKWQHDKNKCEKKGIVDPKRAMINRGGFGSTFTSQPIEMFFLAFENGQIFRPADGWLWADKNASACTLHMRSLDCYFEDLSTCGYKEFESSMKIYDYNTTDFERRVWIDATDMCFLSKEMKKPMIWVYGQVIHYLMRYLPYIRVRIDERIKQSGLFPVMATTAHHPTGGGGGGGAKHHSSNSGGLVEQNLHSSSSSDHPAAVAASTTAAAQATSVIAVHYRAGSPDANRHVFPLEVYMKAVDEKAAEMSALGTPVRMVYFASQDHDPYFKSVEHLSSLFPRNFSYSILPISYQGDGKTEIEHIITNPDPKYSDVSLPALAVEYFTDIEIFVKADVFIGSYSNIYLNVMALRYARHPTRPQANTCYISGESDFLCADKEQGKMINGNLRGFSGGSTFQ